MYYLKPVPKRVNWNSRFTVHRCILAVIVIFSILFMLFYPAQAASDGGWPPLRPDGKLCQPLLGGLTGFQKQINKAGTSYYTEKYAASPLSVSGPITIPFGLSVYDADTTTAITLTQAGAVQYTKIYSTGNDTWSGWDVFITSLDGIQVQPPVQHPSTTLCFTFDTQPTAAPRLSIVLDVATAPTGLDPAPAPDPENVREASGYEGISIPTGTDADLFIRVINTGMAGAKAVMVSLTGDVSDTIPMGDIAPGEYVTERYKVVSHDGINRYVVTLPDGTWSESYWNGTLHLYLPLVNH